MIVLKSPKGWTGPKIVDGLRIEELPFPSSTALVDPAHPDHLKLLETWMKAIIRGAFR